ncbi:hypothetical protein CRENBAI_008028 [Crenichthys baileyi]|uniref:Uncharacterized protein n=1 Tax=Crenichthys baileyi TaxID=28760 RepID=A0AAV9R0X6_9TELE
MPGGEIKLAVHAPKARDKHDKSGVKENTVTFSWPRSAEGEIDFPYCFRTERELLASPGHVLHLEFHRTGNLDNYGKLPPSNNCHILPPSPSAH